MIITIGRWKGSRGTAELFYIDQHILNEIKPRRKNLAMAWINNKKAYDIVPHSWIINSLKMYKISHELYRQNHENLESGIDSRRKKLTESKIQRGILQDVLSPLIFIIALMPLNLIFRKCTAGYKLSRSQEKNQSPNVHGWHQTICKKWKRTGNSNTCS